MNRLLLALLLIPSPSFATVKTVTGEFGDKDAVVINRALRELEQGINGRVNAKPFSLNGSRGTGAETPSIGSNAPALIGTTPYTWIDVQVGTVPCVMPVWRKN